MGPSLHLKTIVASQIRYCLSSLTLKGKILCAQSKSVSQRFSCISGELLPKATRDGSFNALVVPFPTAIHFVYLVIRSYGVFICET